MITENEWEMWQEQGLFNNSVIRLWKSTFGMGIKYQIHYGLILFSRGISCLAMKNKIFIQTKTGTIDPRIPLIYFSDSGSGKGMGANFYQRIFSKVGLKILSLSKPTPERLIGSVNDTIDKENRKKGYTPSDEKYRDPIIHGYFETYDDLIFDEAEPLFSANEYGIDILRKCRMALDSYGSPNNRLKSETLKNQLDYSYPCSCNIMFLSYHTDNLSKTIVSNGIFQRSVNFFYRLGQEEMAEILSTPTSNLYPIMQQNEKKLIKELQEISNFIQSLNKHITISEEAEKRLEKAIKHELEELHLDEDLAKLIQSFLPRIKELVIKDAMTYCLAKKKTEISLIDMEEAITLLLGVGLPSLIREIGLYGILAKEQTQWYKDLRYALGTKWRKKEDINDIMIKYWNKSRQTTINRLKKMITLFVKKKGEKNTQFYKLK